MKIIFMGTPEFAVLCLEGLIQNGFEVALAVTQPDKPVGRKQILTPPAVKVCAEKYGIPVYQPSTLKNGEAEEKLTNIGCDAIVVVAYGKILPAGILNIPRLGCINVHASLLPKLRGASPIQWSIVSGEETTGVTTMLMDEGLDTGDILLSESLKISSDDTAETLHDRLAPVGAQLLIKTLEGLENGTIKPVKQPEGATFAPIISKEMGQLDFTKSSTELYNLIRGFYPWPCCYFEHNKRIKVFKATIGGNTDKNPGEIVVKEGRPFVACGDGRLLELTSICPSGSKKMTGEEAVRGRIFE